MKKFLKRMLLVALLCVPWVTNAQSTLTVADGTETNSYVPIYGWYADAYLRSQFIYPADSLTTMQGQTILSMTFYSNSDATFNGMTMDVSVGIQADTCKFTTSVFDDTTAMTVVYTGTVNIVNGILTIVFDSPFAYTGGHLIVDFQSVTTSSNYPSTEFTGVSSPWSSISGYNYSDISSISSPTRRNFLPKVTFAYGATPTCLRPNNMVFSNVSHNQLTVSWTSNGTPTSYILEYADSIISAGQGTAMVVTDTFATVTNLNAATNYYFLVRGVCGSNVGDTSIALTGDTWTTCVPVASLPYTMTFDNPEDAEVGTTGLPICWGRNNSSTYYYYADYPALTDYGVESSDYGMYWYIYEYYAQHADLVLPQMDTNFIQMNNIMVRFYAEAEPTSIMYLGVLTDPSDENTFVCVDSVLVGEDGGMYEMTTANYVGNGSYLALRHSIPSGSYYASAIADNINVITIPNCLAPTNLNGIATMDEIALSWTPRGEESAWLVNFGDSYVTVSDPEYTVFGLSPDSCITVSVAALCDDGDTSMTTIGSFCTLNRLPITEFPYFCDFEEDTVAARWTLINEGQPNFWMVDSLDETNHNVLYITNDTSTNAYTSNVSSTVYAVNLFYLEAGEYQVSFKWRANGEGTSYAYDYLRAYLAPSNYTFTPGVTAATYSNTPTNFIALEPVNSYGNNCLNSSSTWQTNTVVAHINNTNNYQMAFMWRNDSYTGYDPPAAIDSISIVRMACSQPSNLTVLATTDSMTYSWTSSASEFMVDFNGTVSVVYDTFFIADQLQSGTNYTFSVTAVCGVDTSAAITLTAATQCGLISHFPYIQDFDGVYVNPNDYYSYPTPTCWTKNSEGNYPYMVGSNGINNSQSLYFYTYPTTEKQIIALPPIDTNVYAMNLLDFTLSAKVSYSGDDMNVVVGVMGNPNDTASFVAVDTINVNSTDYTEYTVSLSGYNDTGMYVAIKALPSYYVSIYVDDVMLYRHSNCVRPDSLVAVSYVDSIHLSWVPRGQESQWKLTYNNTEIVVSNPYYTATGLTPETYYTFDVIALCDDGDSSLVRTLTARTACVPESELPYTYGFEDATGNSSYDPSTINGCWIRGTSYTGSTYPYPYNNGAATGSYSLCFYSYNTNWSYAALPMFDLPVDSLQLSFKAKSYSSYYTDGTVQVGVMDNPYDISTFVPVRTITNTDYNNWTEYHVYFNQYTGTGRYIAIYAPATGSYNSNYLLIDDVVVDHAPSCYPSDGFVVVSKGATDATVAWNGNSIGNFMVVYSDGTTSTTVYTTSDTVALTGLSVATDYTVDIYAICAPGDTSTAYTAGFRTLNAMPATVPYSCGFDGTEGSAWNFANEDQPNFWIVGTATYNGTSDNYSLYVTDDSSNNNYSGATAWSFAYRNFNLAAGDYAYSFDWNCNGESSYDYLRVALFPANHGIVAGNSSWTYSSTPADAIVFDGDYRLNLSTGWTTQAGEFTLADSGLYNLVFMWHNDYTVQNQPPAAVDNVLLTINTCPMVSNLAETAVGATMMTVDWTENGTAALWEVECSDGQTVISTYATSHPFTITGLDTLTSYNIRVRPVCGDGDTGLFCQPTAISTSLCDGTVMVSMSDSNSTYTSYNYYFPFYYYGYSSLSQTLLDTNMLGTEPKDFEAISFYYTSTNPMPTRPNVQMYLQPTTKSSFASDADFVSLSTDAIKVYDTTMDANFGWNTYRFDTVFSYDGTSNYILIVLLNNGSSQGGSYFRGVYDDNIRRGVACYSYSGGNIDPQFPSGDYNYTTYGTSYALDLRLVSCASSCAEPTGLTVTEHDYQSVTIQWSASADNYEVAYKAATDADYPAEASITGNSYIIDNLYPGTAYVFRVRAVCDVDVMSEWVEFTFTTDELPCVAPTNLQNTAAELTTATFDWTAGGEETAWRLLVWNANFSQSYDVTTHPYTVTGLTQNTTYNVTVLSVCGGGILESETSDTVSFTTAVCQPVSDVAVSNIGETTATVSWSGDAASYSIEYGLGDFEQGNGTPVNNITTTSYTIEGLTADRNYSVYVRANCDANNASAWSDRVQFHTDPHVGIADVDGVNVSIYPNPTTDNTTIALSGVSGDVTITIVDLSGRTVKTDSMSCDGDCVKTVEVNGLAEGAYFVRVSGENVNMVKKLVVK